MVRSYSASRRVKKIVKRIQHNSHLPLGHQPRAHSCGDLELIKCETDEKNNYQPETLMRDKIVEAKPRRLKKASNKKECSKSKSESSLKESLNGSKSDLTNVEVKENGSKTEKLKKFEQKLDDYKVSKIDLTSSKLVKKGSIEKSEVGNTPIPCNTNHETVDFLSSKLVNGDAWKTKNVNGIGKPAITSTTSRSYRIDRHAKFRDSYSPLFSNDYETVDLLSCKMVNGDAWKLRPSTSTKSINGMGRPAITSTSKSYSLDRQSKIRDSYSALISKDYENIANGNINGIIGRPPISLTSKSYSLDRQGKIRESYSPIFSKDYETFRSHKDVDDIKSIIKLNSLKNERIQINDLT